MKKRILALIFSSFFLSNSAFADTEGDPTEPSDVDFCSTPFGLALDECVNQNPDENSEFLRGVEAGIEKCRQNPGICGVKIKVSHFNTETSDLTIPRILIDTSFGKVFFKASFHLLPEPNEEGDFVFLVNEVSNIPSDDLGFKKECAEGYHHEDDNDHNCNVEDHKNEVVVVIGG